MQVGSVCTRQVVTIDAGSTVAEAACRMRDHPVGSLVVKRAGQLSSLAGVFRDSDSARFPGFGLGSWSRAVDSTRLS
ncbi:CBS domain-containing protein [Hydrogenophaga sp.]|uniref:CBS domain-containing protein n=1 Tax=Hydrogenophaga sp. TaxID=1904254 RepID=UPI002FC644FD